MRSRIVIFGRDGAGALGKLDTLRRELVLEDDEEKTSVRRNTVKREEDDDDDRGILMPVDVDDKEDRWDCETILCIFSFYLLYLDLLTSIFS